MGLRQEVRFCAAPGGPRLAYAVHGNGPPLVRTATWLTHLEFDWQSPVWRHWLDGLADGYTVVRYDEPDCSFACGEGGFSRVTRLGLLPFGSSRASPRMSPGARRAALRAMRSEPVASSRESIRGAASSVTRERLLQIVTLRFGNESLRAGHAEKQARWQDLLAPLIEPRLPDSDHRLLEARAIAAAAISCLQEAIEEWARLGGQAEIFDLYDTAVRAIRRPT